MRREHTAKPYTEGASVVSRLGIKTGKGGSRRVKKSCRPIKAALMTCQWVVPENNGWIGQPERNVSRENKVERSDTYRRQTIYIMGCCLYGQ